jgi:hypothetical protein
MDFAEFLQWEQSTRDTIDFKKMYVDVAGGDLVAGLVLSEIIYWYLGNKLRVVHDGDYWIARGRNKWWERIRLSPSQIDYTLKKLVKLGLVITKVYRFSGLTTLHVRLNTEYFIERVNHFIQNPPGNPYDSDSENSESQMGQIPKADSENGHIPLTESTTESTTNKAGHPTGHPALRQGRFSPSRNTVATSRDVQDKRKIAYDNPEMPPVGRLVIGVLKKLGKSEVSLTRKQCEELRQIVLLDEVPGPLPSPQEEFDAFPGPFQRFMDSIAGSAYMKKNAHTAGNVIKFVRHYGYWQGWYSYRPDAPMKPILDEEDDLDMKQYLASKEIFGG